MWPFYIFITDEKRALRVEKNRDINNVPMDYLFFFTEKSTGRRMWSVEFCVCFSYHLLSYNQNSMWPHGAKMTRWVCLDESTKRHAFGSWLNINWWLFKYNNLKNVSNNRTTHIIGRSLKGWASIGFLVIKTSLCMCVCIWVCLFACYRSEFLT